MLFMLFYSCGQDLQSWVHRKPNYSSSCNGNTSFWESQVAKTHIFFLGGGGAEVHLHYFFNRNLYLFVNDIIYLEKPTEVTDHHSRAMDTKPRNTILMARSLPLTSNIETQLIGGPRYTATRMTKGRTAQSPGVSGENVKTLIKGTEEFPHRRRNRPFSRVGWRPITKMSFSTEQSRHWMQSETQF